MTVRCKFRCDSVSTQLSYANGPLLHSAAFSPVYSSEPNHENKRFWDATPNGSLQVGTIKEMPFEVGKEYYLDITLAE